MGTLYSTGCSTLTWMMGAPILLFTVAGQATELRIQCPAGTGAVLKGDTVVCQPLPASPSSAPPTKVLVVPTAPPSSGPSQPTPVGLELAGLHSIPDVCGLDQLKESVGEQAAEAVHIAIGECAAEVGAEPALTPTRWMVFKVEAISETKHEVTAPKGETWTTAMDDCLLRQPPRLPRAVRGRTFTVWYLMSTHAGDLPSIALCGAPRRPAGR